MASVENSGKQDYISKQDSLTATSSHVGASSASEEFKISILIFYRVYRIISDIKYIISDNGSAEFWMVEFFKTVLNSKDLKEQDCPHKLVNEDALILITNF